MALTVIYNIDEAYNILKEKGVTKTSLYRAIQNGRLTAVRIGKRYFISECSLNSFLEIGYSIKSEN